MSKYHITIPGRLTGLNEYIAAERTNRYKAAALKRDSQGYVCVYIRKCLRNVHIAKPVKLRYTWHEPNRKRDLDNVASFGHKVIQDALKECRVITDDSPKYVVGFSDEFRVDKNNPRIEVEIEEV